MKFEPAGLTDDPDIRMSQSIMDYIFRRLALDYLSFDERAELGIYTATERARQVQTGSYLPEDEELSEAESLKNDAGDDVPTDQLSADAEVEAPAGRGSGTQGGPHHLGVVRVDHRDQHRRAALLHLRHQDAAQRQLLRLRGLRQHQRLQLSPGEPDARRGLELGRWSPAELRLAGAGPRGRVQVGSCSLP